MNPPETPRRVITGIRDGKSVFVSDGPVPNTHHYTALPGHMTSVVYATAARPNLPQDQAEQAPPRMPVPPAPGETRLMIVTMPPDTVFAGADAEAAVAEQATHIPGLIDTFEPDAPGMHTTDTVDYDIVLDGEIWLELDDGAQTRLTRGDVVVQCGTRHAWRNKSDQNATLCFVLIGAAR
ncbi:cupin domain-containing protein [Roseinatronobacter alkalisoli]|uniref:Cupin domain-containing protein n=1 Tax=Roseinatronobacter alkalisoli TaxID=3028235 RepID=A0ABT5TCJ9_9RHOB|nr:cupin domain-containing protein [Roseinatronobacter sp. HJB301]MDD7972850.1 cupin domain-containing protein [Roseinatronobacter sp. HJB301]